MLLPLPAQGGCAMTNPPLSPTQPGLHVLAADDDAMGARLIGLFLQRLGHSATVVASGLEVLTHVESAAARGQPFDLLLLDLEMPGLNGLSTLERLRERGFTLATIALTGHNEIEHRQRCQRAGFAGYLSKPLRMADLEAEMRRVVQAQQAATEPLQSAADADAGPHDWLRRSLQELQIDETTLAMLLRAFLASSAGDGQQLQAALERGDSGTVQHYAHRLRGSLGSLAMHELAEQAKQLERLARDQQLAEAAAIAAPFSEGLHSFCADAQTWLTQKH